MKNQLVVNWHVLEKCNFKCRYCFAHWGNCDHQQEIWRNSILSRKLLTELQYIPDHVSGDWDKIRLNIAGGEPMLLLKRGHLDDIFEEANALGFDLSIISNGYLMTDGFIKKWAPKLQIIGISVDSPCVNTNLKIGRANKSGKQITISRVADIFRLARFYNRKIECKLNTVVNAINWTEDFHSLIKETAPDRWKVFKMLPIADTREISDQQAPLKITDEQFNYFLENHKRLINIMSPEDNDAMTESYLMIDPLGRFYQNESHNENYKHAMSDPVYEVGVAKALRQIAFSYDKYKNRYKHYNIKVVT